MSSAPECTHICSLGQDDGIRQQGRKKVCVYNKLVHVQRRVVVVVTLTFQKKLKNKYVKL